MIPEHQKPLKVKPMFYACCLPEMQQIARDLGYNLVVHGSLNRDMDLIAIAWSDNPYNPLVLLHQLCEYLGAGKYEKEEEYLFTILPGGRKSYVIDLNRGGKWNGYKDEQYYLDISFTPVKKIHIDTLRGLLKQFEDREITVSKMAEILNEL